MKSLPENGLALFSGLCEDENGKEDHITLAIEPLKPLRRGFYRCDNRFHTELLLEQLVDGHARFGFIILDGSDASFYLLNGKNRETLFEWSKVNLPKKHGRGGQSQNRFARIREEKRELYVNRVAELTIDHFITENVCNVQGLILAGCADLKNELFAKLDPRLKASVLTIVDVQYNGISGFNECLEKCSAVLADSEYMQEIRLLGRFFELVKTEQPVVYGVAETMKTLVDSGGAVETLLVSEHLEAVTALLLPLSSSATEVQRFFGSVEEINAKAARDKMKIVSTQNLLSWLGENIQTYGATLETISDTSNTSHQFTAGFGGLAAILRYQWVPEDYDEVPTPESEESYEW